MKNPNNTCCFTGHRALSREEICSLSPRLMSAVLSLYEQGYRHFVAGGALGFDTLAATMILRMKPKYPDLTLTLVFPCADQTRGWAAADIARYEALRAEADEVICLAPAYFNGCMRVRNQRMVDMSRACIAYVTHARSGSAQTMNMATRAGHTVINLGDSAQR